MASFTHLVAQRIKQHRQEFEVGLSPETANALDATLARGVQRMWHRVDPTKLNAPDDDRGVTAAVDGSRATRALNSGAQWVIAQALLMASDGTELTEAETLLLRGECEQPAVDRCASMLMRSLELGLALTFAQRTTSGVLLLDGSLYAELPHLLYSLAVPGQADLPLLVLQRYLDLFDCCQNHGILLLGIAKSARSTVLGRTILDGNVDSFAVHGDLHSRANVCLGMGDVAIPDTLERASAADVLRPQTHDDSATGVLDASFDASFPGMPTDAEILHRWTQGEGLTSPVLLGTRSFGHRRTSVTRGPDSLAQQFANGSRFSPAERRDILGRLRTAPAIGTFYVRLAAGDDVLRVDALASAFGMPKDHLLDFPSRVLAHQAALPLLQPLRRDYGGATVYNAALYVVDREVRLHAQTVDRVYLSILRSQVSAPIQFDRSTRRFMR